MCLIDVGVLLERRKKNRCFNDVEVLLERGKEKKVFKSCGGYFCKKGKNMCLIVLGYLRKEGGKIL